MAHYTPHGGGRKRHASRCADVCAAKNIRTRENRAKRALQELTLQDTRHRQRWYRWCTARFAKTHPGIAVSRDAWVPMQMPPKNMSNRKAKIIARKAKLREEALREALRIW